MVLPRFSVLITHRDIVGGAPENSELQNLLSKYQRREVIFLISKLSAVLGTWRNAPNIYLDEQLSRIFLKKYRDLLIELRQGSELTRIVFSRITLLYLLKQACLASPENGAVVSSEEAYADIGLAALMANDLLLPFIPSDHRSTLEKLASIMPFSDYMSNEGYAIEIARGQKLFEMASTLPALRAKRDFIDVRQCFENTFGMPHTTFCQLIFGCGTKFINVTMDDLLSPNAVTLSEIYFQKSIVPLETAKRFFGKLSISDSELAESVKKNAIVRPGDDFTMLQAHPLVTLAEGLFTCFDPGFLFDKAGRNLYWTLFASLDDAEKTKLGGFWGIVFEEYVNQLFAESYKAEGTFHPSPKFPNDDEAFDACICERGSLIVFEHKSSTLRADAKYGGDIEKLRKDLNLKFVDGDGRDAKGIAQLRKSLLRFLRGESINGIKCTDIHTIYPCLVCLDSSVSVPYMAAYFKDRFKEAFPRKAFRQTVAPLFTLSVGDIESLLGYLENFQFSDILESFYSNNRKMLFSLSSSHVPILRGVKPRPNMLQERFSKFSMELERDLFPNEAAG